MRTFSSTVAPGRMLVIWYERAIALREIVWGGRPVMSSPRKTIWPLEGFNTPVRQLKNVDLPAPLGPMIPRISPAGTASETLLRAVNPPNRTVSCSVRRIGAVPVTLRELACRGNQGLFLRDHLEELVLAILDREDELAQERLVVFLAERLVALGEVVALLDLHPFEGLDELHRVLAPAEARLLDSQFQEVHGLEVRLDVAVRQRAGRVDLLEGRDGLVEELLVVGRVERRVHDGHVAVDPDEPLDLLAERRQVGRLGDGAVAGILVLLGQPEVVNGAREVDGVGAEEDAEQSVERAADLRDEWRHVSGTERHAGGPDDLTTVLLDLLGVRITRGLPPRVIQVREVPLLAHLVDEVWRDRDSLSGRVVEGPEDEAAALGRRDRGVQANADHPDGPVLLEDRHAGEADVREVAALGDVDLVLEDELLGLAAAHVGFRLVIGDHQLDGPTIDPAGVVDSVDRHLGTHQGGLPAGRRRSGERLENTDLERLGLTERLAPGRRHQHGGAHRTRRGGRETQKPTPGGLAAPPQIFSPGLVLPAFSHRSSSSEMPVRGATGMP